MKRGFLALLVALALISAPAAADARPAITIMVYMCGSDLESQWGAATADINEMLYAQGGENLTIVMETGGTQNWRNSVMEGGHSQRWAIRNGELFALESSAARDMTDPATLTGFINYCAQSYPADRYMLIFWDHGGGSLYGFGQDENFPGGSLTIDEIESALGESGVRFDMIGFDACLMATAETALAVSGWSGYLVASQQTEPGVGWYYTDWITRLGQDTAMPIPQLGRLIADGYVDSCEQSAQGQEATLSVIDLALFLKSAPGWIDLFAKEANSLIESGGYAGLARARGGARAFGYDAHDMVDLIDLINRSNTPSGERIAGGLEQAVVYSAASRGIQNANGLSVYFPMNDLGALERMLKVYRDISWSEQYESLIGDFASIRAGGQALTESSATPFVQAQPQAPSQTPQPGGGLWEALTGDMIAEAVGQSALTDWFNSLLVEQEAPSMVENSLNDDELELTLKGDNYVLSLPEERWDQIVDIQLQVFVDDGEGYIDLGSDDLYEYDEDGDLVCGYDYEWVALNGQVVCFYAGEYQESGDFFRYSGYVPALVNGKWREIVLAWDSEHEGGYVVGARPAFTEASLPDKGLEKILPGDEVQPLCDYYAYDDRFEDSYPFGDPFRVNGDIAVQYEDIGGERALVCYRLEDIYGNSYWTEELVYE